MARLFQYESSVRRCMRKNKFDSKVQESFFITLVNNGLPLFFFVAVCLCAVITRSLYTTGYVVLCFAVCLSVAYTLWYFVTYMFMFVLVYIQKIVQGIWATNVSSFKESSTGMSKKSKPTKED